MTYVISYEFSLLDASSHNKVILALGSGIISNLDLIGICMGCMHTAVSGMDVCHNMAVAILKRKIHTPNNYIL